MLSLNIGGNPAHDPFNIRRVGERSHLASTWNVVIHVGKTYRGILLGKSNAVMKDGVWNFETIDNILRGEGTHSSLSTSGGLIVEIPSIRNGDIRDNQKSLRILQKWAKNQGLGVNYIGNTYIRFIYASE